MKRQTIGTWALVILLSANLGIGLCVHCQEKAEKDDIYREIDSLMEVIQLIRQNYVDVEKTSGKSLFKGALEGVAATLDPYSAYLEGKEQEILKEETDGEFGGIGIQVDFKDRRLVIVSPIDGTPAHAAGLQSGDMVLKVDGVDVGDLGLEKTIEKMRGKPGTTVRLQYMRDGFDEPRELDLTRAMIPIHSVTRAKVEDGIGYVRVTQFMMKTGDELKEELQKKFSGDDVKGLIIDLRDNPGGLLHVAVQICSFFLPKDTFVVSVEGRRDSSVFKAEDDYKFRDIPLVLLVDKGSASAAEITAGCLKVNGRAKLVGEKTFGKGSVQNVLPLTNGGELKLTIAYYYVQPKTVAGRVRVHGNGIVPDVAVTYSEDELRALADRFDQFKLSQQEPGLTEAQRLQRSEEFWNDRNREDKVILKAREVLQEAIKARTAEKPAAEKAAAPAAEKTAAPAAEKPAP